MKTLLKLLFPHFSGRIWWKFPEESQTSGWSKVDEFSEKKTYSIFKSTINCSQCIGKDTWIKYLFLPDFRYLSEHFRLFPAIFRKTRPLRWSLRLQLPKSKVNPLKLHQLEVGWASRRLQAQEKFWIRFFQRCTVNYQTKRNSLGYNYKEIYYFWRKMALLGNFVSQAGICSRIWIQFPVWCNPVGLKYRHSDHHPTTPVTYCATTAMRVSQQDVASSYKKKVDRDLVT